MQIICRRSKLWQLSAYSVIAFLKYIQVFMRLTIMSLDNTVYGVSILSTLQGDPGFLNNS